MPESPDYLSLFRSFVPEETPEQKATRLLRERQDRIPTITPARTAEQGLEEYVQKTGGVEGYAQQVVGGQQAFDAAAGQLAAEEARAASGMENVGKFTSSPLLSSTGSLQDVAQLYNKPVESFLKSTGLPQVGGFAGEAVGQLAQDVSGTQADLPGIGRSIGESVPRMVAGGLTSGLGMAADVGLEALAETGDPLSAAGQAGLTGLTMGAAGAGGRAGERMVADWLTKQIVPRPAGLADQLLNRQVVNEALTGVLPKVGAGVGAATAAGGVMEAARQVQEGPSNPFTAENVFSQTANAVVFGGIHAVGALKSPRNLEAQSRLQSWFQDYAKAETAQRRGAQTEFNTDVRAQQARPLIEESLSGTDRHPEARQNWWVTTMDKAAQTTDPVARATAVTEMADQLVSTKDLNRVVLTARALSKTTPPETLPAMVDVAKRYNELRSYMFRMLDEQAAGGADVPSAEGLKQMERQKDIPEMNLEWLKSKFGDNVERTLTGDDSQAFRILGQQVTNQVAILARHGREVRARRLTTESIAAPDESASNAEDVQVTAGFVAAVNSIPVKEIRDKLAERYLHHEEHDQRYGKGETDKFMEEITDVVTKITEGKTPEQIAALDWANVSAQVERRVVQLNEAGEEIRPIVSKETKLSDYIAKNDAEEYVKKIYGRPNRSQRELLAQEGQDLTEVVGAEDKVPVPAADEANWQYDLGQEAPGTQSVEATIPEVKGAGKAPKGLYDPALDKPAETSGLDTEEMARQMKANIESMDDRKAWTTLAPELVTARGTVDARKREAIQPFAKQVVAAVLELGTGRKARGEQTGEGVGPAGLALLQAKGMPEMTFEKYRAWMDELMNARVNPKYRENLVKRLIGPVTPKVTLSAVGGPVPTGVKSLPGIGASNTGWGSADLHRVLTTHFLNLGYTPQEMAPFVTIGQQIAQNFARGIEFSPLARESAYRNLTPAQEAGKQRIGMEQVETLGVYSEPSLTPTGKPAIALAIAHDAGLLPKELAVWQVLASLGHELVHDVQFRGGAYSDEYTRARKNMEVVANTYTTPVKAQLLELALKATVPAKFLYNKDGVMHPVIAGLVNYGSRGAGSMDVPSYEFVNTFSEVMMLGILTNGSGTTIRPEEVFSALPTEAALFAKGVFRNYHDNLGALVAAIKDPSVWDDASAPSVRNRNNIATQMEWLVKETAKLVKSKEPMQSLWEAQTIVKALEGKNWSGPMTEVVLKKPDVESGELVAEFSKSKQAVTVTQDLLFGPQDWHKTQSTEPPMDDKYAVTFEMPPPKVPKVTQAELGFPEEPSNRKPQLNIGGFWKWAGLFQQTMLHMDKRGLPLAQDVGKAFLGLMPAQQRISIGIWKPFMVRDGKFDPNSPLMALRNDKTLQGRQNVKALNDILYWQQRNEKTALEQRPGGEWGLTTEATADGLGDAFGHIPQVVAGSLLGIREVSRNQGQQLLSSRMQSTAYRVAKLLMASQPKELLPLEYDRTLEAAGMIVRGMVFDQQASIAQGLQVFTQPQRDATVKLLQGGMIEQLKNLNDMVTNRSDWWSNEQRPGSHLVVGKKPSGEKFSQPAYSMRESQLMLKDLTAKGYKEVEIVSKSEKAKLEQFDSPEGILHRYMEMEQQAMEEFVTKNPANLTPEQLALIETYAPQAGAAVGEMLTKRGTNVYLKQRRGVPTAYGLDYVDAMREYISRMSGTIARQMTQQQVDLILSDARLKGQDEFKTLVKENLQAALTPSSEWQRTASSAVSSYFLAANLSSAVVNGFDTVSSLPESLLSVGGAKYGMRHAMGDYARGVSDMIRFVIEGKENQVMLQQAKVKMQRGVKLTPEETKVWALQRAYEMKLLDRGQMQEIAEDTDIKALAARAFGTNQVFPSAIDMAKDPAYRVLQMSMVLPRMVHAVNNEVAFFAGLSQAVDAGMGPQAALDHANRVRVLATFGGGKANPTGAMGRVAAAPAALSVVRLGATMQSYAFGLVSKYVSHASVMLDQDPNLTPLAKKQARQGFAHLLASHLALSGILGLGGVAAAMTLLQKYFNVQAEAGVRKGITATASVMTDDPSVQGMVTELAMNGAANQLFGAAVGQRVGMQNILGMSSYDGFNLLDVVPGAAAGVLSNVVKGLGYFAQGEPMQGARSLAPGFLKNAVEMAGNTMKYGDTTFRTPEGQPIFTPTKFEQGLYAAGFQPSRLTEKRSLSRLTTAASKAQQQEDAKKRDEAARQMLRGNLSPARELQQVANTASFPRTVGEATGTLRSLADRASVLNSPQDPLASVSYAGSPEARRIVQTFPAGTRTPASEVDRAKTRILLEAQAGVPVDVGTATEEMKRALLVEEAMKKGMTRAEALKWVGLVTGR